MGGVQSSHPGDRGSVLGLTDDETISLIPCFRTSLRESYILNKNTVLKLKKTSIWSVESNILDSRGFYVFRKSGSFLTNSLEFRDDAGNILASVEKKGTCSQSIAWVMLGKDTSSVIASLYHRFRGAKSRVHIYIHHPFISEMELEDSVDRPPDLKVEGNFSSHHYHFYNNNNIKIAQASRNIEPQMYNLEIGPNVDIAFISICSATIDLLQLKASITPWDVCTALLLPADSDDDINEELEGSEEERERLAAD